MIAEFSLMPIGTGEDLANHIAVAVKTVDDSGLEYQLTSMGTIVEGSWKEIVDLLTKVHDDIIQDVPRLEMNVRLDDHKDRQNMIASRVHEMEELTGRELSESF